MHFTAFMARASSVPTLQFTSDEPIKSESKRRKKVILVEDLPNIFSSEVTRAAFRNTLVGFVKAHRGAAIAVPMVLIISEALSKPSTDNEWAAESYNWNDNVSVRSILPPEILKGGKCTEIKFNPVADTILKKGLDLMLDKALSAKKALRPSASAVAAVVRSANGDIRSAVNNLQFLVREGKHAGLKIMEQAPAKGKKRARSGKFKDDDDAELCVHPFCSV
jgi:cell cycle checkpoint protein